MNRSLESVIEEIAENEEMSKEFMAMDEIDEIYAYCKSMGLGSSEEEFDEEVSSMINNFDIYASELDKNSLNLVAGGGSLNKHFNKVVASALSALVLTGAGAANSNIASGMNMPGKAITASSDRVEKRVDDKKETSKSDVDATSDSRFVKIKKSLEDYYNRGVKYASEHKKGTIATIAAIILVAVYTGFAIHNKDANPLHWFGSRTEGGSQDRTHVGGASSLSDADKATIDDVVTSLSSDVTTHQLTADSLQKIEELKDKFGTNGEALSYLSQKLKDLGYNPAKVDSDSQASSVTSVFVDKMPFDDDVPLDDSDSGKSSMTSHGGTGSSDGDYTVQVLPNVDFSNLPKEINGFSLPDVSNDPEGYSKVVDVLGQFNVVRNGDKTKEKIFDPEHRSSPLDFWSFSANRSIRTDLSPSEKNYINSFLAAQFGKKYTPPASSAEESK